MNTQHRRPIRRVFAVIHSLALLLTFTRCGKGSLYHAEGRHEQGHLTDTGGSK